VQREEDRARDVRDREGHGLANPTSRVLVEELVALR